MHSHVRLLPLFIRLTPLFTRTGSKKREFSWRDRQKTLGYSAFPVLLWSAILFVGSSTGLAWAEDERFKACRTAAGFDEKNVFDITQPISQPREAIRLCHAAIQDNPKEDRLKAYLGWALYGDGRNREARQWIEQSKDSVIGSTLMGVSYEYGIGVNRDLAEAGDWYDRALFRDHRPRSEPSIIATTQKGLFYLYGWGGKDKKPEYAYDNFQEAANQGYDRACFFLGNLLRDGLGTKKDVSTAMDWYQKAAMKGHADALQALKDLAHVGYAQAYISVGNVYLNAEPPLKDKARAKSWYEQGVAAERSGALKHTQDRIEQLYLGTMHRDLGESEQAVYWFRKAAEQGHTDAQLQLATMLAQGQGVRQDWSQAANWYRKAALRGNKDAQAALALLYQDHPEIKRTYNAARSPGVTGAFCKCDEKDAFRGVAKNFTDFELELIKEIYETVDPRRPIDRLSKRFKQLNVTGQVVVLNRIDGKVTEVGFGNGILFPGNLVLTNAHIIGGEGTYVRFNIGQTDPGSPNRFADSVLGKVVALGSSMGSIPGDWALIVLDDREVNLNEKYGSANYKKMSKEEFIQAGNIPESAGCPANNIVTH
jgi:TPR repeat protein